MFSVATKPAAECALLLFGPPEGDLSNMIEQHPRYQQSGHARKQSREKKEQDDQLPGVEQMRHDESDGCQPRTLEKFPAWYGVVHCAASLVDRGERLIGRELGRFRSVLPMICGWRDAEPFHLVKQGGALQSKSRGCTPWATQLPVGPLARGENLSTDFVLESWI
jgi:hypothetical protein